MAILAEIFHWIISSSSDLCVLYGLHIQQVFQVLGGVFGSDVAFIGHFKHAQLEWNQVI